MMMELAEHAEHHDKAACEESAPAANESLTFLFKQIMGCIAEFASQMPPMYEPTDEPTDVEGKEKEAINHYKALIRQLKDTNREIVAKQCRQANTLKDHFENLRNYIDLREISRQKLEISSIRLKSDIIKLKQQITEFEQKNEMKSLHHSEDVHSLQQLVQRLVNGESASTPNVLSMSQGGSLFQNPHAPTLSIRDAPIITREPTRDPNRDTNIAASLQYLFESNNLSPRRNTPLPSLAKHSPRLPGVDFDVGVVELDEPRSHEKAAAGSLRDLQEISRLSEDEIRERDRDAFEISRFMRDAREKREARSSQEIRRFDGRNGSFSKYSEEPHSHIEDESEENERKRQKTEAERRGNKLSPLQPPLRSTHPRSPNAASSPHLQPHTPTSFNQHPPYQSPPTRPTSTSVSNSIRKLSNSAGSPPPPTAIKSEKPDQPAQPASGSTTEPKKQPSEIWASEVLLAFSQGTDSPTEGSPALGTSGDLKRRHSTDTNNLSNNNNNNNHHATGSSTPKESNITRNPLLASGGLVNGSSSASEREANSDDQVTIRRIEDRDFAMRRSSGSLDEYAFARSSGGMPGLGPVIGGGSSSSNHKKRRGKLPETATSLLKRWLLEHQQHPYPTEEEKAGLATTTSLTLNQINNWFTNARRRILPKQKHNGSSPPSSPPLGSSAGSSLLHHDDDFYESAGASGSHTFGSPRHGSSTPTSPPSSYASHSFTPISNSSSSSRDSREARDGRESRDSIREVRDIPRDSRLHSSSGHPSNISSGFNSPTSSQSPSPLTLPLSHLPSTPLMAQLTAQLAQRLSSNSSSRSQTPTTPTSILSLSKRSVELENPDAKATHVDADEPPTTAPHTISLAHKKDIFDPPIDRPITISGEIIQKSSGLFSKSHPLKISSPIPQPVSTSPIPPIITTTASHTPAATLSTPTSSTTPTSSSSRPPIFPSHPLFATSSGSSLASLAQLGVSVVTPQETPQQSSAS